MVVMLYDFFVRLRPRRLLVVFGMSLLHAYSCQRLESWYPNSNKPWRFEIDKSTTTTTKFNRLHTWEWTYPKAPRRILKITPLFPPWDILLPWRAIHNSTACPKLRPMVPLDVKYQWLKVIYVIYFWYWLCDSEVALGWIPNAKWWPSSGSWWNLKAKPACPVLLPMYLLIWQASLSAVKRLGPGPHICWQLLASPKQSPGGKIDMWAGEVFIGALQWVGTRNIHSETNPKTPPAGLREATKQHIGLFKANSEEITLWE